MPTLNRRKGDVEGNQSPWFIVTPGSNHPFTFQVEQTGYELLQNSGLGDGDDIDWDVFQLLKGLGMLYTLNTSYTPADAPIPDSVSLDELSQEDRLGVALELLDTFSPTELCENEGTLDFLLSFGSWEGSTRPILEEILEDTPFTALTIGDWKTAIRRYIDHDLDRNTDYNPILLALFLRIGYDNLDESVIDENHDYEIIWHYDDWFVCAGSSVIFHTIRNGIEKKQPDPVADAISKSTGLFIKQPGFYEFFMYELSAISASQFGEYILELNEDLANVVCRGLETPEPPHYMILPAPTTGGNEPVESDAKSGQW